MDDLEGCIKRIQAELPWTELFSEAHTKQIEEGGFAFFDHALKHVQISIGELAKIVHEYSHREFDHKEATAQIAAAHIARIFTACLKMAKEYPGDELDIAPHVLLHFQNNRKE